MAELGSAFVMSYLGLQNSTIESHASYVNSWLQVLRNDKNAVFTASRHANYAYHYILGLAGTPEASHS